MVATTAEQIMDTRPVTALARRMPHFLEIGTGPALRIVISAGLAPAWLLVGAGSVACSIQCARALSSGSQVVGPSGWANLVGKVGLEPTRPKAQAPKACASANSATSPRVRPLATCAPRLLLWYRREQWDRVGTHTRLDSYGGVIVFRLSRFPVQIRVRRSQ